MNKIKSFFDLNAWKMGHELALDIYKATNQFPSEEKFGLISQIRRASVSITSNISEGFGRRTAKDKIRFYSISSGSIAEVQNQLIISRDLGYIDQPSFNRLFSQSQQVQMLIFGLIRSANNHLKY